MNIAIARVLLVLSLMAAVPAFAGPALHGWTKVEIDGCHGPISHLLERFRATDIRDYDVFTIATVPQGMVDGLTRAARAEGVSVRQRDELNVLRFPHSTLDVREGTRNAPPEGLIRSYPPASTGLFVLQLAGPVRREWVAELETLGWTLTRYVPHNGYIAVGRADLLAKTRRLEFVQWLDFYHPYQKYAHLMRDGVTRRLMFELPTGPNVDDAIAAIERQADGPVYVYRGSLDTLVYASMAHGKAEGLLHQELIIGVGPESATEYSDEMQGISLTNQLNPTQSAPTAPGYWNWVTSSTRCPECSDMPAASWQIGLADTGLDNGKDQPGGRLDLAGRKYYGEAYYNDSSCNGIVGCDWAGHGTMVAGIAIGNGATNLPSGGYLYGTGIAPTAGAFLTQHYDPGTWVLGEPLKVFVFTSDAAANGVTIQNHSFNDYATPDTSGQYSALARHYDTAVRDADDSESSARVPLFISVSAGNNNQGSQATSARLLVNPGGTAKNVLSVSGTESARGQTCLGCGSDSYQNIMALSRVGTSISGYLKPDVLAPASAIVSTHTSVRDQQNFGYCNKNVGGVADYGQSSGTSYAAPVGAAAGLIVKRYLGSTPADTSPALTKAMLIAGARSIKGGLNQAAGGTTIPSAPNPQQGFGRLSFDDILTGSTRPGLVIYDQSASRTLTQTGEERVARLRVRDSSKPVKIVLVWTDHPGSSFSPLPLVNDLNLEVTRGNGATRYAGNRLTTAEVSQAYTPTDTYTPDSVNNVEYARFVGNASEEFGVRVIAQNIAGDINGISGFEQDFALVVVNAEVVSPLLPPAPQSLSATATGTSVTVTWSQVQSAATAYTVERKTSTTSGWTPLQSTNATGLTDTTDTTNGITLYRVRAMVSGEQSDYSETDSSWSGTFTDDPIITSGTSRTAIKAVHITELRAVVNAFRLFHNPAQPPLYLSAALNPANLQGLLIDSDDLELLRQSFVAARNDAGVTKPMVYNTPYPALGGEVNDAQVVDLRNGVK